MIQFTQVSKAFGTQQVLNEVSFTVHDGERAGFVGPNGAGKSTIFELLTGNQTPDKGEATYPGSKRLAYVRQQLHGIANGVPLLDYVENAMPDLEALHDQMMVLEEKLQQIQDESSRARLLQQLGEMQTRYEHEGGYELKNRAETILSGLGFAAQRFHDQFNAFSGGWKIRAELARNLVARPDILLLDEPTNYLDVPAVEWLQSFLRTFDGTLLLISHDRYLLNSLTNVTFEVMGGVVTRYNGNYSQYIRLRESRHDQLLSTQRNIDRKREQLERFVDRFRYKAAKATQAQSKQKMLDKLEDVEIQQVYVKPPKITLPKPPRSGDEVARIEDGGFSYDGIHPVLEHVDMRIMRGDKAAFVGLNGMGKTTLLRLLAGKMDLTAGRLVMGHGVLVGYQSQDYVETMNPGKTIFETVREGSADRSDGELRNMLGGFGFHGTEIDKQVQVLSGGEKVRLALARLLLRPNNFLLLDEPTTHLDIYAREALEEALKEYQGTLCLVSHDITFVRNLATTIYALTPGKVTRYYGDYDYYREKLAEQVASEVQTEIPSAGKPQQPAPAVGKPAINRHELKRLEAQVRAQFSPERRKWEKAVADAETESARLEKELGDLFQKLSSGADNLDYEALNKRVPVVQRKIEEATARWENASLKLEDVLKRQDSELKKLQL